MAEVDSDYDAVILDDTSKCPQCQRRKAGPPSQQGLCNRCLRSLKEEDPQPTDYTEAARRELAERELARRRFLPFMRRMVPNYKVGWFHADLAARLERFSNRVARGEGPRLIINVPPRRGKSEQASKGLPSWHLGRHPDHRIISTTHSDKLAMDNSRDVLRYIKDEKYQQVFPGVHLDKDNKGAMGWRTEQGGVYKPSGVGAGITGYGANILIIDDPHKDSKDAFSEAVRESVWSWYKSSAITRLLPGGGVVLIQCMVGDTQVTMADGSVKLLRDIRPGDMVASYNDGSIEPRRVLNWTSQGEDRVYTVTLSNDGSVRANARHPFLVDDHGGTRWVRLKDLRPGMHLVATEMGVTPPCTHERSASITTTGHPSRKTARNFHSRASTGARTKAGRASYKDVMRRCIAGIVASVTMGSSTISGEKPRGDTIPPTLGEAAICGIGTGSPWRSTTPCLPRKTTSALFAALRRIKQTVHEIGATLLRSIIATKPTRCAGSSATTVTSSSVTPSMPTPCEALSITSTRIEAIEPDGVEEVFDIQVEGAENFIANGVVSHNTRWHLDDLTGRVLDEEGLIEEGGKWEQVLYPEEALHDEYRMPDGRIVYDDPPEGATLLRRKGELLHPERYGITDAEDAKRDPVVWQALYQQAPTAGEAAQFNEGVLEKCECRMEDIPASSELTYYTTWDTALFLRERNDYTVALTGGIDRGGVLWVVDVMRARFESDELVQAILDNFVHWEQDLVGIEKTQYTVGLQSSLETQMSRNRKWARLPYVLLEHGNKDKVARSQPIQAWMRQGLVRIPTDAPWFDDFRKELLEFPGGKHDDQVDALAYLGQMLDEMTTPRSVERHARKPKRGSKEDLLRRYAAKQRGGRRSWKTA